MKEPNRTWPLLLGLLLLAGPPTTRAQPPASNGDTISLTTDDVDIKQLIRLVSDETGKRFILDDSISGQVSLVAPEKIPREEFFPFVLSVLESMGYSAVEKNGAYALVKLPDRTSAQGEVVGATNAIPAAGLLTKVFQLEHTDAQALKTVVEKMVRGGDQGAVNAFAANNNLIVTDTANSLRLVEKLIADLDKPRTAGTIEIIKLEHSSPTQMAETLTRALAASRSAGEAFVNQVRRNTGVGAAPAEVTVIPADQSRSIIVVGSPAKLAEIKSIVAALDVEEAAGRGRLNAIFLNYLSAEAIAKTLNGLLEKRAVQNQPATIAIEPDLSNNALLVDAAPADFEYIESLVKELDRKPQQVLVEILIAEISVDRGVDLGVEWASIDNPGDGASTVVGRSRPAAVDEINELVTQSAFPQGLSLGVARGTYTTLSGQVLPRVPFLLNALAQDRDVKILSNVPLWAQNNAEATVSVVENIPVLRSTIEGGSGTARDVIQNIERMDVGIQLSVTPLVSPDGDVTLKLKPGIEAIIDAGPADQPFTPTIAKREVDTTVTIPDKATVVISGLMREDVIKENRRVPVLGSIPLLGHLFRSTSNTRQRTNLLIFVTPHVVTDTLEQEKVQQDWEGKTGLNPDLEFEPIDVEPPPHVLDFEIKSNK